MQIKDKNKDIDLNLIERMEVRARDLLREATKARLRTMRVEGIRHDDEMDNIRILPYETTSR